MWHALQGVLRLKPELIKDNYFANHRKNFFSEETILIYSNVALKMQFVFFF